ncbi:MAG: phenylalanine--tRNA ligase subunit alpha [Pseudomonadales bacterium]|nr:phenylalanine--tRNA ligase subunit alpha [Pseudomonadales bacterium]
MSESVDTLRERLQTALSAATSGEAVEQIRVDFLGKKGAITALLKSLGTLDPEARRQAGQAINSLKVDAQAAIDERKEALLDAADGVVIDVTMPGASVAVGGLHPITRMMYDLDDAFAALNFEVYQGPEISTEDFEFDHMNFPPDHPARESMDTYWIGNASDNRPTCLRPHLTGGSVRRMLQGPPPYRFVYPGHVYRNETTDARHERAFVQYEALIVDRDVPFTAGKLLIDTILETVFGRPVKTRMRAGFFPFVEPGYEIDMECQVCGGKGCSLCKHVGWLEVMPGGVPHPNVLRAAGVDPDQWTGFYVNVGLDRLVMMRYGIDDVRLFHGGDLRFLRQFR